MQIIDNRGLLLRLRNPAKITTAIPTSKSVGENGVLVKWGVDEARVLKNLNIKDVPSPIMGKYDWPGRYKPFEHQKTTASFLTMNRRAFCFNEQGTGKTASAIWAADFLMKERAIKRVLINGDAEFVIINYDGVEIVKEEVANGGFDLIIVDEATHYKNAQSKRWKVLASVMKPDTWLWLMTGTPAAQSPVDAYGLAKLVNPKEVPRFFGAFRELVMHKVTQFKWAPKPNATEIVYNALQPAIRFTKEQCLDLPEMTYVKREVELTAQQKKFYEILRKQMMTTAGGEQITAANAAVNMNKLLQISCGAVYSDTGETVEFDVKNRYKVLREVIDESSQKVLIFVPFKHVIDILKEKLNKDGITNDVINGDVSANKRTAIFKEFQETDNPRVLIIQPQAAAHGVTLTAANTIVWWGPTSSLETYAQANARVHRSGQKHPCTVVQLQGSPVEKRIYKMLDERINIHTKMIDLYQDILEL